jgi:hypothetical protein
MSGYSPTIIWAGPIRRVSANCRECAWGTDVNATVRSRRHLLANPSHHVIVEATNITVFSTLTAPEAVGHAG